MVPLRGRGMDVACLLSVLLMQAIATTPAACNEGVDAGCAPSDDGLTSLVQLTKVSADRRSKKATDVKSNVTGLKKNAPSVKYVPLGYGSKHIKGLNVSYKYMDLTEVAFSNLGKQGPDFGGPEGMRFKNVYILDGEEHIDLLVKAVTEYLPTDAAVNGHVGNVGAITMQGGTNTTFQFKLLSSYCYDYQYNYQYYGDYSSLVREGVAKESAEEEEDKEDDNVKLSGYYGYYGYYPDGYYSDGYYPDGYYSDGYYSDGYYSDGYSGYYSNYLYYTGYSDYYYDDYEYYKSPTHCKPVSVNRLLVSFYDIDNGRKKFKEVVRASHYQHAYLSNDTTIKVVKQEGAVQTQFRSTSRDPTWKGQKIPGELQTLTAQQRAHAITLSFRLTSSWDVTLATPGGSPTSRNFFFSGIPLFPSCVDHDEPKDLLFDKVTYRNLGGLGPDLESPEGIRFEKVVMQNGKFLDLIVLLGDSLAPPLLGIPALNGVFNGIGAISMVTATKAKFNFTFVQSDDDMPACVDDFMFSVLDMHPLASMPSFQEKITLSDVDVAYLAEGSDISVSTLDGGETVFLGPTAPDFFRQSSNDFLITSVLDAEQERRSITVNYKNVCDFEMEIDLTSADTQEQYTTYFKGMTSLVNAEETVSCES